MELSEKIIVLETEKLALDQMVRESLQNVFILKKEILLLSINLEKEKELNASIKKELEEIKNQLKEKEAQIEYSIE